MKKLKDEFQVAKLINELYSKMNQTMSNQLKDIGLTHQQTMIIKLIAHNKKITISEICNEMTLSKGTVSGIVSRLEKLGLVIKVKDEEDLRNTYVVFSEKGNLFAQKFRDEMNHCFEEIFKNFTSEELEHFKYVLKTANGKIK